MSIVFLAAFTTGLLLLVLSMLFGFERESASVSIAYPDPSRRPTIRYWVAIAAAFGAAFGMVGYLLLRYSVLDRAMVIAFAVAAGALAAWANVGIVNRAIAFVPEHDPDDPRYVLQGHVAQVTAAIAPGSDGEILFTIGEGEVRRVPARGIEGSSAEVGSDVVIEKIEDGVAWVEPWSVVEQRL